MSSGRRRAQLRERTSEAHSALDARVAPLFGAEGYRHYLAGLHTFRAAAESRLDDAAYPAAFDGWRPTRIAGLLEDDLADLGAPAHPVALALPERPDPSEACGIAYVLEGSAFGARLLIRMAGSLGYDESHGARHLAAQSRTLDNWRHFEACLERAEPFDLASAVTAACATFDAANAAFERTTHAAT